ncbi:OLC1v1004781C1 [Oldenlandia corymbosa var. corymbosa]|uniref:OLC1v1004781C1 n=1 Tax=Oldenlandia corymbosa var. corymbosa TaxID=529605 RepID=A0AAV1DDB6_OLDCO|nr:OLC1v1004781C1 [Oldenlandia corymbosa var. corymbosa]
MYYQSSSEIQGDGLQTLYLMNPNFTGGGGYSESQQQPQQQGSQHQQQPTAANMVILNYAAAAGNPMNFAAIASGQQQAQTQHHLVGVPLHQSNNNNNSSNDLKLVNHLSVDSSHQHEHPSPASRPQPGTGTHVIPHFHHGLWGSLDHTGVGGGSPSTHHIPSGVVISNNNNNPVDVGGTQLGFHRPPPTSQQQGLSLTLSSSQQQHHQQQHGYLVNTPIGILSPRNVATGLSGSSSSVSNGIPPSGGFQGTVFGSKYLKAAQELLDELVNVGKSDEKGKEKGKVHKELSTGLTAVEASQQTGQSDSKTSPTTELTVAQRQELQMKKAKLVSMLDEVEQRYRQYHHQMQIVVASFEQAAGIGSAKSYTQLALQTISKQFRCLKDAISSQIKSASKSLGEDHESLGGGKLEGSRLKFVDQQLRQQRALQQLGMMQNNTWRPQRGLPERAVSVLRAWLFEHFLHPYPKDSDKQMLAKQTGLTRSQVCINHSQLPQISRVIFFFLVLNGGWREPISTSVYQSCLHSKQYLLLL